jgi:hypothetical protein
MIILLGAILLNGLIAIAILRDGESGSAYGDENSTSSGAGCQQF